MPATSKNFVAVADAQIDTDSPIDTTLLTSIRDSLVHLREWLGASYFAGAVQDHNHDGSNSAAIDTGVLVKNGSFESGLSGWTTTPFTGGSIATNTANHMDGATAIAVTSTSTANGGGEVMSAGFTALTGALRDLLVSVGVKASVANVSSKVEVYWYDNAQAQISISTVYTSTNTGTTSSLQTAQFTPPSTARFFKLKLTGGVPASGSAFGTVYFDGVAATMDLPVDATLGSIGSVILAVWVPTSPVTAGATLSVNSTVAGSILRYGWSTNSSPFSGYGSTGSPGGGAVTYAGGGTALSGTWRCLGTVANTYGPGFAGGCCLPIVFATGNWPTALFVRIS